MYTVKEARAKIRALKMEIAAKDFPDPVRTAPPAEVEQYLAGMTAGANNLATLENAANLRHIFGDPVDETVEEFEGRVRRFEIQMRAVVHDEATIARAVEAYRDREPRRVVGA